MYIKPVKGVPEQMEQGIHIQGLWIAYDWFIAQDFTLLRLLNIEIYYMNIYTHMYVYYIYIWDEIIHLSYNM